MVVWFMYVPIRICSTLWLQRGRNCQNGG